MTNDCGRTKALKDFKANSKTYKVEKGKGPGYKKRNLFLAGTSKARRRRKKKKKAAQEHPLAKAFTDSLSQTTSHISTKLSQDLSDKLQIALSRITATTARSRTYLTSALELKNRQFTSSFLLSAVFKEEVAQFQELIEEKEKLLDGLWVGWAECIRDIEILDRDEGILKQKDDSLSVDNQHEAPDETVDDAEFDRLVEEIKTVGRVWVKKMEDSEKKIAHEVLQQQQLAATVLL